MVETGTILSHGSDVTYSLTGDGRSPDGMPLHETMRAFVPVVFGMRDVKCEI